MLQASLISKSSLAKIDTGVSTKSINSSKLNIKKNNKARYETFSKQEDIPLFLQPWWLDIACSQSGLEWDVILYEKGGHIWGSFVYTYKNKMGFKIIAPPILTPITGPYIKYPSNQKIAKKLSWEKEIMSYFIDNLPKFDNFIMCFHHSIDNWLPFYWKGFKQTTEYTHVIEDLSNLDSVYENFDHMARNNIKRALKKDVKVIDSDDIEKFYEINKITFDKQGVKMSYSLEYIKELYIKAKDRDSVIIKFAKKDNKVYSVIMGVYDKNTLYILLAGSNRTIQTYGAEYLLFWEMMKFASEHNLSYDFEGSIIEGVEKRNRSFGAIPKPMFQITKTPSKILSVKKFVDSLRRG